jgi:hypothetical protein
MKVKACLSVTGTMMVVEKVGERDSLLCNREIKLLIDIFLSYVLLRDPLSGHKIFGFSCLFTLSNHTHKNVEKMNFHGTN